MSIIDVTTYTSMDAVLTSDTIKQLVAADLGVDVSRVSLKYRLKVADYDGPGCPTYEFDNIEVKITNPMTP